MAKQIAAAAPRLSRVFYCFVSFWGSLLNINSSSGYQLYLALSFGPQNYFHLFVVGDSLKVCTWVAEGTGQVVSASASVRAWPKADPGASSSAKPKAESGTSSSSSRRPRVITIEDLSGTKHSLSRSALAGRFLQSRCRRPPSSLQSIFQEQCLIASLL